jgi:hypothetical protein
MFLIMTIACPNCGAEMTLRTTNKFKYRNGSPRKFYGCSRWPLCNGILASHPNGEVASTPADPETKALRKEAHSIAELIWGAWDDPLADKFGMYRWLEKNTSSGHIGKLSKTELHIVIKKLKHLLS